MHKVKAEGQRAERQGGGIREGYLVEDGLGGRADDVDAGTRGLGLVDDRA